jgi:hypothetical protein
MGHQVPTNPRLYNMVVFQAKLKYTKYPSPGASHWVHEEYLKKGGQFAEANEDTRRKKMYIKAQVARRNEKFAAKSKDKKQDDKKGDK